jgi:hypothetical protein
MHPAIGHHLARARMADMRHQAQQEALASAARHARPGLRGTAGWPALGRRVRAALGSRGT